MAVIPRLAGKELQRVRAALVGVVVLLRLPSLFEPQWYSDDGFFTTVAWAMSKGVTLYAGIFDNQPPGIFWFYRLLLLLGAQTNHAVVQVAAMLLVVATALLTLEAARRLRLLPWPATAAALLTGIALSIPTLDGDLINVELAALPLFLGGLVLAHSDRRTATFAAGALLAAALVVRPSYVVDGIALLVPLLSAAGRVRRLLLAAAGGAATALVVCLALYLEGSLGAYLALVLPGDHAYLVWSNGGSLLPVEVRLLVCGAVAAIAFSRAQTPGGRLLAIWLPASLAGASLTPREFTHYSHEAIPPLALALASISAWIPRRMLAAPVAAVALGVSIELLLALPAQQTALMTSSRGPAPLLHNFGWRELPGYYANWAGYVAGTQTRARYESYFYGVDQDRADERLVRSEAPAGSRIVILGDSPWVYLHSGLLPAGRYLATNSAFWRIPSAPGEMQRTLRGGCAAVVIYHSGPGDWHPDLRAGGYQEIPGAPAESYRSTRTDPPCG